ncbi:MAG: N-acetylmuramoyl-L-alanine amidase [Robiginitomaculum sp.]|nr:N-acetylmuramoyl-L-alanine amidase [Robiginitomaculum sp.]
MKFIDTPSPNHDKRTLPVTLLVLHYTGMENGKAALERMCDPTAKVAAHYMVEEDGRIFKLVEETRRAWHAGISAWGGETDINSASIGIEIVNGGHDFGLPGFPDTQIQAVIKLSRDIMRRNVITDFGVVAHSDIAPGRKQDPGEKFPWSILADAGIGIWPDVKTTDQRILFDQNATGRQIRTIQIALAYLGYGVAVTETMDDATLNAIQAFQRRYRPTKIDGIIDVQTMETLSLLVRYKKRFST